MRGESSLPSAAVRNLFVHGIEETLVHCLQRSAGYSPRVALAVSTRGLLGENTNFPAQQHISDINKRCREGLDWIPLPASSTD